MHFIRPHRPHSAPQLQNILLRDMKLGYFSFFAASLKPKVRFDLEYLVYV